MRLRHGVTSLALALTLGLSACDPGTLVLPILTITMTWEVEGDPDRFFSFNSEDDGESSGTFEGEEERNGEFAPLSGSWAGGVVTFTVVGPQQSVTYQAEFEEDNPSRLTFVADHETITLTQG